MRADAATLASVTEAVVVLLAGTIAVAAWSLDSVTSQRVIGALLSAELVAFSMAIYVYYRPPTMNAGAGWLLTGCAAVAVLLVMALGLAGV